jgi:uncharacterized NAD(P)/FAD-binding protein YdhS
MQTVVIVGAGFTGAMTAIHLAQLAAAANFPPASAGSGILRIVLIERSGRFGRGSAYGTSCGAHLLNVPAGRMSAFADRPDHFLEWVGRRDSAAEGGSFVPRMWYGEYLEELLSQPSLDIVGGPGGGVERVAAEVLAIEPAAEREGGGTLHLSDGASLAADRIVLALGNFAPADPLAAVADEQITSDSRYAADPWRCDWQTGLDPAAPVLLIGTGLTMVDMALALRERGHTGSIHAISRRGLLPQPHRTPPKRHHLPAPATMDLWPSTALGMLRGLRREVERAGRRGINWREVVTSIRDQTPALWQRLSEQERRRFLNHLRAFWETHRHRTAPEAAAAITEMRRAGQLRVLAGRIVACTAPSDALRITIRPRGREDVISLHCERIINCTGPRTDLSRIDEPLVRDLLGHGLIRADGLGLGLDASEDGAVIGAGGRASTWLYAAGPLRKPHLWETTAVPELRVQAREVARAVMGSLAGRTAEGVGASA